MKANRDATRHSRGSGIFTMPQARHPALGVFIVLGLLAFGCAEPQPPQLPERVNARLGEFESECIKAPQEAVNAAARRGATDEALAPARSNIEFMESAVREARAALLQGQQEVAVGWLSRAVGACDAVKAAIAQGF